MDKDFLPEYLVDTFFLNSCLIYSYLIVRDFPVQVFPALYYSQSKRYSNVSEYVIMETVMRNEAFSDNRS